MASPADRHAEPFERISLRTPTLPPATETNTYLVGEGGAFYVIEPATPYAAERRQLFERVRQRAAHGERLLGAIVTHHHRDHTGAAAALRKEFGVPVLAHRVTQSLLEGHVPVDRTLDEGDELLEGALRVLHTPGHAPGHVCLWNAREKWLIAGDMVASVGTIIIDPDDAGDMKAYLDELARLIALGPARLYPAHGDPIEDAIGRLEFYVRHRLAREAKVFDAIPQGAPGADLGAIVAKAYDDTPVMLWPLAMKSARAHLAKLVDDGRLVMDGDRWRHP